MGTDLNTGTFSVTTRFRKDQLGDYYYRRVEWAERIERLAELDVPKRLKMAQELCGNMTPEVAQLGIEVLLEAKPDDANRAGIPEFLKELPKNHRVTASALVRADNLLHWRDGKKWLDTEQRRSLVARFTDRLPNDDAEVVLAHVIRWHDEQSPRGVPFTASEAAGILSKIATNPVQPKAVQKMVVEAVVKNSNRVIPRPDFTFQVLAAVIRSGVDDDTRLLAAKGLARFKWSIPSQRDELCAILKDERNADVAKALQAVIDMSK